MSDELHKAQAIETNQLAWKLLESHENPTLLVHAAHASAYHWSLAGGPAQWQRAEWLLARVYSELGFGASALRHARRCMELTDAHPEAMKDFDHAYAFEGLARAHATDGERTPAQRYRLRARQAGAAIAGPEDRQIFEKDFAAGNWHGVTDD